MIRLLLSFGALSLVSACNTTLETNGQETAQVLRSQDHQFENSIIIVRSFTTGSDSKNVEVAGATCSGKNAWIALANFTTPAQISVPSYLQGDRFADRGKPPALNLKCRYNGKELNSSLIPQNARGNVSRSSGGQYNAQTGTYSNPSVVSLTSKLSPTLPWYYPSLAIDF
jgi:hypothetical protein